MVRESLQANNADSDSLALSGDGFTQALLLTASHWH